MRLARAANHPRRARPTQQTQQQKRNHDARNRRHIQRQHRPRRNQHQKDRHRDHQVNQHRHAAIPPAPKPAGRKAQHRRQSNGQNARRRGQQQRNPRPGQQTRRPVSPQLIGPQKVLRSRQRIGLFAKLLVIAGRHQKLPRQRRQGQRHQQTCGQSLHCPPLVRKMNCEAKSVIALADTVSTPTNNVMPTSSGKSRAKAACNAN